MIKNGTENGVYEAGETRNEREAGENEIESLDMADKNLS